MKRLVCADIGIVLAKQEWKICGVGETLGEDRFRCPAWLDMNPIQTLESGEGRV